uniref:Uncharacterized protein n=2 Tax=Eutreptiella gymnastica TaxID=73025 RepID=A0A7S1IFR2_9EUGL|mmetsp:Transcript_153459/g.268339  ORF Transcript_153459/g.268339 Transcript_153459/m.268339 type:complete len:184 (+) Transcript_153459:331-882(+)
MRELRGHLKKLRQQGTVVYIQPEDDHHVNAGKLGNLDALAKLDAIYSKREEDRKAALFGYPDDTLTSGGSNASTVSSAADGHSVVAGPAGRHLQEYIPDTVMADFLAKSAAVRSGKALSSSTTSMQSSGDPGLDRAGLGSVAEKGATHVPQEGDDDFRLYQKRMMLAYKYRPNPLGNPRTPYY